MFDKITNLNNLFPAYHEFRRGKRSKPDVQEFERHLEDNIFQLHEDLVFGRYRHGLYHRFHIFDPKHRVIHKANVRDRLVHHAIYRILSPIFEHSFIFDSYSCRIGKGTHTAVRRLEKFTRKVSKNYTKSCWALKLDIKKSFDSINHQILLNTLSQKISCPKTNNLLAEIVRSYNSCHCERNAVKRSKPAGLPPDSRDCFVASLRSAPRNDTRERELKGIPIGNLTSQLFANVYMDAFDHFIKEKLHIKYYLRYTDDFVIIHQDQNQLKQLIQPIQIWLKQHRELKLHPNKIILRKLSQGIDFLGYIVLPHYCVLRTKTKRRMLRGGEFG